MVEALASSMAVALIGTASTDQDFMDVDSLDEASLATDSWAATGTTMDMPTGTESPPVTTSVPGSASA
jgi:hypothetical protein